MTAFLDLTDLASESLGGAALACNDEFFAEKDNLLRDHAAVWKDHVYTDRGKWMDGWETRRRRPAPGPDEHDWCVIRLGLPGVIHGVVVDTAFFRGNYPQACALWATEIDDPLDVAALARARWVEILPRSPLTGDHKNAFAIAERGRFTHVRLDIYPDGGVARLRVHGEVVPRWDLLRAQGGPIDLAALAHGAVVESCSDMFFGRRENLIKPGPSRSMADGWETRRRRGPGHDWALIRLAAVGTIEQLELDTSHFKGNAPGRCVVEGIHAPGRPAGALGPESSGWRTLVASPLEPHRRAVLASELRRIGPVSHLRLSVYPDGGIARLRALGTLAEPPPVGLARLNDLPEAEAIAALRRCCGATRWAEAMAAARPFEDVPALLRIAERIWWELDEVAHREAFAAHPAIGETTAPPAGDTAWSAGEQRQATTAAPELLAQLAAANRAYLERHGFLFIVCATGRSAGEMLDELRARTPSALVDELRTAAEEQIKITRLRLAKLIGALA